MRMQCDTYLLCAGCIGAFSVHSTMVQLLPESVAPHVPLSGAQPQQPVLPSSCNARGKFRTLDAMRSGGGVCRQPRTVTQQSMDDFLRARTTELRDEGLPQYSAFGQAAHEFKEKRIAAQRVPSPAGAPRFASQLHPDSHNAEGEIRFARGSP